MELKEVKRLLEKFFDGQTTVEEENKLAGYFADGDVPEELTVYAQFFSAKEELLKSQDSEFKEEVMAYVIEKYHRKKSQPRWLLRTVSAVAASVIIAFVLVNYNANNKYEWEDTYDDPEIAYAEATKTMRYIAGKYQKGLATLEPISKIRESLSSMETASRLVSKGFEEMDKVKKVNRKLKKE